MEIIPHLSFLPHGHEETVKDFSYFETKDTKQPAVKVITLRCLRTEDRRTVGLYYGSAGHLILLFT